MNVRFISAKVYPQATAKLRIEGRPLLPAPVAGGQTGAGGKPRRIHAVLQLLRIDHNITSEGITTEIRLVHLGCIIFGGARGERQSEYSDGQNLEAAARFHDVPLNSQAWMRSAHSTMPQ